jgi:Sulfotransferase domain
MTLKVIGAGFGRTGTLSLKVALEQLGFGPCYHMVEVFKNPDAPAWWVEAADGNADWDKVFRGYNACVDWPAATFYAGLADIYPDAKVILTEREPEAWFRSTQATIFPRATPLDTAAPFDQMFRKVIARLFDYRMRDHDHVIDVFARHNAEVRRRIAPDRLLVYEVAQGWEPLCRFLGVAVPSTPMPKTNSTEEFGRHVGPARNE